MPSGWESWETPIPNSVLIDNRLSRTERLLYAILLARQGTNASCWASQAQLCQDMGLKDRNHITELVGSLVAWGLVEVTPGRRRGHHYRVKRPTLMQAPACPNAGSSLHSNAGPTPQNDASNAGSSLHGKTIERSRQRKEIERPVSSWIAGVMDDFSREFGDQAHTGANITQALRLWQASGQSEADFIALMQQAKATTRHYQAGGVQNKAAYFFTVLRNLLNPNNV